MKRFSLSKAACVVALFCAAMAAASSAQTLYTIAHFYGPTTGWQPHNMSLIQGTDGAFYGTTWYQAPGVAGYGTVFKLTSSGNLTPVHGFCNLGNCPEGSHPLGGLVQAANGDLYGTATSGGTYGYGTVFKVTPTGTLTTLHSFNSNDGNTPEGPLTLAADGSFYGATRAGGNLTCNSTAGCGTVFKITAAGALTVIHAFNGSDGQFPQGGLVLAKDGNFYGTSYLGGSHNAGTVFKITAAGTLTTLYSFCAQANCPDGQYPNGMLVQASDNNFYGTAYTGGAHNYGTIFKITPSGTLTTLYSFDQTHGAYPQGGLVQGTDGNLYGTTLQGGSVAPYTHGAIFKITTAGALSVLHNFDYNNNGAHPAGGLLQATDGKFYGTTSSGSIGSQGTAFMLDAGLGPFIVIRPTSGTAGTAVVILGSNLSGASQVRFNGTAATFAVVSSSEIDTTVPAGATTGKISVVTPSGTLYSNVNFVVSGSGGPIVTLSPTSLNFGNQSVNTASAARLVTMKNTGSAALSITGKAIIGTHAADYAQTSTCGTSLAAGANCTFSVTFKPTASGTRTASLRITDNASGSPHTVSLTGIGTTVKLLPASLSFGTVAVGVTTSAKTVTLTNLGTTALTITGKAITGTHATDYAQTSTCGTSLATGASCTFRVTFKPTASGTRTASLRITDNASGSPHTVSLTGIGTTAKLVPTSLSFGTVAIGVSSPAKTITLTNLGTTPLTITGKSITGTHAADYAQTSTCGTSLAAGASCTFSVTFKPTASGTRTASLRITDNASGSPHAVSLTGIGTTAKLVPTSLSFGTVAIGVTSPAKTITLTNLGTTPLTITGKSITGTHAADYAQTSTCGTSLAASASCTFAVTFKPTASGTRTASLRITDNASGSPHTASLTGTGQ